MSTDDFDTQLDRACADGKVTANDADEIRRFAAFLEDAGTPGTRQGAKAWREHYPEDYALAEAEKQAREGKP